MKLAYLRSQVEVVQTNLGRNEGRKRPACNEAHLGYCAARLAQLILENRSDSVQSYIVAPYFWLTS